MILESRGFVASLAEQTASGRSALIAVYTWIPGLLMVLAWGIMAAYKLDREYPRIITELQERRANGSANAAHHE